MAKTILCTTNFSASSKHAVQWAVNLARQLKAHVTILYTYRLIKSHNGEAVALKKQIEKEALQHFEDLEQDILEGQNVSYDFRIEIGFVTDRIEQLIQKTPVTFLVMDKEQMSANNKESFEELVEQIKIPLVIVP
ncbi:MAG TPA: universal stress protein [Cyclobacteriaceae bacterium]|nr:universal stress protein [Cyclobacteriaceae bacterium]